MAAVEPRKTQTRPGSHAITSSALADLFGIPSRRASEMIDRLPQEKLDRVGRERVVPLWLARETWPNVFRDWPPPGASSARAVS